MFKIYLARSNKVNGARFGRAIKIVKNDLKMLEYNPDYCSIHYHDKLRSYNPSIIKSCDLVLFITYNDENGIGRGLYDQIVACKDESIPHYHLSVEDVGSPLTNRGYRYIINTKILDSAEYDERYGKIIRGGNVRADTVFKHIGEKIKKINGYVERRRTFCSYDDLKSYVLSEGDIVSFIDPFDHSKRIRYRVERSFLYQLPDHKPPMGILNYCASGGEIYENVSDLWMGYRTTEVRRSYAKKYYGYDATEGTWPGYHLGDYEAITRLVLAMYQFLENKRKSMFKRDISEEEVKCTIDKPLNTLTNGKIIEVQRLSPTIIGGERGRESSVSGRPGESKIGLGHLSHQSIFGRSPEKEG